MLFRNFLYLPPKTIELQQKLNKLDIYIILWMRLQGNLLKQNLQLKKKKWLNCLLFSQIRMLKNREKGSSQFPRDKSNIFKLLS